MLRRGQAVTVQAEGGQEGGGGAAEGEEQDGQLLLRQVALLHAGRVQAPGDGRQALRETGGQVHIAQLVRLTSLSTEAGKEGVGLLQGELAAGQVDHGEAGGVGRSQEQGRRREGQQQVQQVYLGQLGGQEGEGRGQGEELVLRQHDAGQGDPYQASHGAAQQLRRHGEQVG